ncbi:MAG: hypothetical protein RLZZ135_448, partial [Cyanobacteriota bacterium]
MDTQSSRGLLAMTQLTDPDLEYSELRRDNEGGHSIASNGTAIAIPTEHADLPSEDIRVAALKATLEKHRGERQIILIQDFPDPDALSG